MAADDLQSKATDLLKKVVTAGVGAAFLTEDGLKSLLQEVKLPKELLTGILDSAGKTKKEFLQTISHEIVGKLMERVDPRLLMDEIVSRYDIHLNVQVGLTPKKKKKKGAKANVADSDDES